MVIHNVTFISQQLAYKPWAEISCGVASAKMVLDYLGCTNRCIDYVRLGKLLRVDVEHKYKDRNSKNSENDDDVLGVYPQDVLDYLPFARSSGTFVTGYNYNRLLAFLNRYPVMIGLRQGEHGHWGVAIGIDRESIYYLNPYHKSRRRQVFNRTNMTRVWDGEHLEISPLSPSRQRLSRAGK